MADEKILNEIADKLEPKTGRAFIRAVEKMRANFNINDIAMRIEAGDVRGALRLLPNDKIRDALEPFAGIISDAVIRGGKLGAKDVRGTE